MRPVKLLARRDRRAQQRAAAAREEFQAELRRVYDEEGLTTRELSALVGISHARLAEILQRTGPLRPPARRPKVEA